MTHHHASNSDASGARRLDRRRFVGITPSCCCAEPAALSAPALAVQCQGPARAPDAQKPVRASFSIATAGCARMFPRSSLKTTPSASRIVRACWQRSQASHARCSRCRWCSSRSKSRCTARHQDFASVERWSGGVGPRLCMVTFLAWANGGDVYERLPGAPVSARASCQLAPTPPGISAVRPRLRRDG